MTAQLKIVRERAAAEILGVHPRTLPRWRAEGRGPAFVRLSDGVVGYDVVDLEAFVAARKVGTRDQAAEPAQKSA